MDELGGWVGFPEQRAGSGGASAQAALTWILRSSAACPTCCCRPRLAAPLRLGSDLVLPLLLAGCPPPLRGAIRWVPAEPLLSLLSLSEELQPGAEVRNSWMGVRQLVDE